MPVIERVILFLCLISSDIYLISSPGCLPDAAHSSAAPESVKQWTIYPPIASKYTIS